VVIALELDPLAGLLLGGIGPDQVLDLLDGGFALRSQPS